MGNSLSDQLLKAGVVNKAEVNRSKKSKHKKAKQYGNKKIETVSEATLQVQKTQAEKVERDRELNRQRMKEAEHKAIAGQVRQLIELNRQPKDDGETTFSFEDQQKVKRIFVSEELRVQLAIGRLSIVKLDDQYEVIPRKVAEKIQVRDDACVIFCNELKDNDDDKDDPYSDYQIPDDLMW
ncbi:MAG: DUF2058 domain-containing protein [Methylococcaceae bacterium]